MRRVAQVAALLLPLAGCAPSKFDELRGSGDAEGQDAEVLVDGSSDDASELDASADGAPSDSEVPEPVDAGCEPAPDGGRKLVLAGKPIELARLKHPNNVSTRMLTATAWLGENRVWLLPNTVPKATPDAGAPAGYLSVAFDDPASQPWEEDGPSSKPWTLLDALDAKGLPLPFLSRTPDEVAQLFGLSVPSLIRRSGDANDGLAYVRKTKGFAPAHEVWLAEIKAGSTTASYLPGPLFSGSDPMFAMGAHRGEQYVKLFACSAVPGAAGSDPTFPCKLARVRVEDVTLREKYEVRTAVASGPGMWSSDFSKAAPVFEGIDGDLSVSWNNYLGQALAVHSAYFSNRVQFHTAPSIDGPWSDAGEITLEPAPPVWTISAAREQPGLVQRCGQRIILSHWFPTVAKPGQLPEAGDVVLSAIDFE